MPSANPRPIVVVLGSGRSGTSLLMQVLAMLGLKLSEQLIEARRDNPVGFHEDAGIVRIQANLMRALGVWPYHPPPADWLAAPATAAAARELTALLHARLARTDGLWGFKDPRTAPFLPLWRHLYDELGLEPRHVLALRQPGSIIQSFMAAYQTPADTAERVWLRRTSDALWHTQAACHIVHYEDWFRRAREQAEGLARFTGLDQAGVGASIRNIVRPDLNRSAGSDYALRNPAARALWEALSDCRGDAFDRAWLLRIVAACRDHQEAGPGGPLERTG